MTVTTENVDEVDRSGRSSPGHGLLQDVVPACGEVVGDDRRRRDGVDEVGDGRGLAAGRAGSRAGPPLGRRRSSATPVATGRAFGLRVHERLATRCSMPTEADDVAARDWFYRHLAGIDFLHTPRWLVGAKLLRSIVRASGWHPGRERVRTAAGLPPRRTSSSGRCPGKETGQAFDLRRARVHGRRRRRASVGPDGGGRRGGRPVRPDHPGTTAGLHLHDGSPRHRSVDPRVRTSRTACSTPSENEELRRLLRLTVLADDPTSGDGPYQVLARAGPQPTDFSVTCRRGGLTPQAWMLFLLAAASRSVEQARSHPAAVVTSFRCCTALHRSRPSTRTAVGDRSAGSMTTSHLRPAGRAPHPGLGEDVITGRPAANCIGAR